MAEFGFGQKTGQIMQMAYVVEDIRAAMNWWIMDGKTGPWFLLDSFTGPDQIYRGEQARSDVAIAMSFAGHMNIELIQPLPKLPLEALMPLVLALLGMASIRGIEKIKKVAK